MTSSLTSATRRKRKASSLDLSSDLQHTNQSASIKKLRSSVPSLSSSTCGTPNQTSPSLVFRTKRNATSASCLCTDDQYPSKKRDVTIIIPPSSHAYDVVEPSNAFGKHSLFNSVSSGYTTHHPLYSQLSNLEGVPNAQPVDDIKSHSPLSTIEQADSSSIECSDNQIVLYRPPDSSIASIGVDCPLRLWRSYSPSQLAEMQQRAIVSTLAGGDLSTVSLRLPPSPFYWKIATDRITDDAPDNGLVEQQKPQPSQIFPFRVCDASKAIREDAMDDDDNMEGV